MKNLIPLILAALPLVSQAQSATGPYIGATFGYIAAEDKGTVYAPPPISLTVKTSPQGRSMAILGGYNWKLNGQLAVGIEADYEFRNGSDHADYKSNAPVPPLVGKTQLSAAASLRGRIGYAATENAMVYLTAGYAAAKAKRSMDSAIPLPPGLAEPHSNWQDGWTAGLGVDYAFTKNVSARVEYRYADYGEVTQSNAFFLPEKKELTEQSLRIGAVYSF